MTKQELIEALAHFDDVVQVGHWCEHGAYAPVHAVSGSNMTGVVLHATGNRPPDTLLSLPAEPEPEPG